ncbi:MAG: hypothetical protein ACE5GE_05390 [Phycisphaerae bacterium]
MTKRETIDRIMNRNPSARPEFLVQFCEADLAEYLRQLEAVGSDPRRRRAPLAFSDAALFCDQVG